MVHEMDEAEPQTVITGRNVWFVSLHFWLIAVLAWLLWCTAFPVWQFFSMLVGQFLLAILGLSWLVWIGLYLWRKRKGALREQWRRFLVAPALVLLTFGLVAYDVPFKLRWNLSEQDFAEVARTAPPEVARGEVQVFRTSGHIGGYEVRKAERAGEGVIFWFRGEGFDNHGVAYLPDGPFPELETGSFERPRFDAIGNGWYTWSAGW